MVIANEDGKHKTMNKLEQPDDTEIGWKDNKDTHDEIHEQNQHAKIPTPDGGYGWVIVLGSFMTMLFVGGVSRADGIIYLQFKSRFDTSAQLAAWPQALQTSLGLLIGPFTAMFVNHYSVRTSFLIGTTLTTLGCILNGFAPNIYFLFFSHSILQGIGRGMFGSPVIVNQYFDKHRSLAAGLSSSGVGIGTFAIVPLTQYLFDYFGFEGAFLISSGLLMQCYIVAMLFRPLSRHQKFVATSRYQQRTTIRTTSISVDDATGPFQSNLQLETVSSPKSRNGKKLEDKAKQKLLTSELNGLDKTAQTNTESHQVNIEKENKQTSTTKIGVKSTLSILFPVDKSYRNFKRSSKNKSSLFDFYLLKDIPFLMFCIGNQFVGLGFRIIFMFLPAISLEKDLTPTQAALTLTICGITETGGRLIAGFVLNMKIFRNSRPLIFSLLVLALSGMSFIIPFLHGFASFAVTFGAVGLILGAVASQMVVVLTDLTCRELLASSLGISKLFSGIGMLAGPPIAGSLKDSLGDFDAAYYLSGGCMLLSACLLGLSSYLFRQKTR